MGSALDDIFGFLKAANELEKVNRIEAATKYYEAVYLIRRHIERIPKEARENAQIVRLLTEKAKHYEDVAKDLMQDDASMLIPAAIAPDEMSAMTYSPRSPLLSNRSQSIRQFFPEEDTSMIFSHSKEIDSATSQVNTKLALALDCDENGKSADAIKFYLQATEICLKAIALCKEHGVTDVADVLKHQAGQTLDRVAELKHPQRRSSSIRNLAPDRAANLTKEEIDVLITSSKISSRIFLPWSDSDAKALAVECQRKRAPLYTDPDGMLPLSSKQLERFHRWARPSEILRQRQQTAVLGSVLKPLPPSPVIVKSITPYTIVQKYVTDCSFIASLCICATFERRFGKKLITSMIYPQDNQGKLLYNPAGKYMVKLWLNGVARCVVIDDYLPVDKKGNLLCSQTTHNSDSTLELWVCLIEKAYMKLCGGYDFPGSNSGVDLFSLTGWIPERILFAKDPANVKDYETPAERAWERIFSASSYGDCLITVSTQTELAEVQAEKVGLVTGHAYAVLSVHQTKNGTRLLQLKNPWATKGWKGQYSNHDSMSWRSAAFREEVGYDPSKISQQDDGVFFISWEDIQKYFQNFHMSWNPDLFSSRLSVHGCWPKLQGPNDDTFNISENPQYTLALSKAAIKKKATLWILISRHVTKQEQAGNEAKDYLTVHIHRSSEKRERIAYPGRSGNCVLTGCYTNNPHVLVRYDVEGEADKNLSLVLSQYKKTNDLNYTLSCYCTEEFFLGKPEKDLQHKYEFAQETWSTYTAGGPVGQDNFIKNPQYSVHVPHACSMELRVATTTTIAANVMLLPVRSHGDTVDKAVGEPALDTGKYRHGFCASERRTIKSGTYTLIVSNFHPNQTGLFGITLLSNSPKIQMEKMQL